MKKAISLLTALLLVFSCIPCLAEENAGTVRLTFTYQSDCRKDTSGNYTAACYYSDSYFSHSAAQYDPSLATMSVSLAMAAFSRDGGGWGVKYENAAALLRDMGFTEESIRYNSFFAETPRADSIAVIAGNKPVTVNGQPCTLIALAVRGGNYGLEWVSNFTLGPEGTHAGFAKAGDDALDFMKEYISEQGITGPVKIWVTGYSRGAAAANLLGAALDEGALSNTGITCTPEDIFVYCFECPAGAVRAEITDPSLYGNIFNILNRNDPVPYLAPDILDFCRYGTDVYLPEPDTYAGDYEAARSRMLSVFFGLDSAEPGMDLSFRLNKFPFLDVPLESGSASDAADVPPLLTQGMFLQNITDHLAGEIIGSREIYAAEYEDAVEIFFYALVGWSGSGIDRLFSSLLRQAKEDAVPFSLGLLWDVIFGTDGSGKRTAALLDQWLRQALRDAAVPENDAAALMNAMPVLFDALFRLFTRHPGEVITLILNAEQLGNGHRQELCYSWLASMDPNYR